jgi:alpha-glucosidase
MPLQILPDGFDITLNDKLLLRHRSVAPCLFLGRGDADVEMRQGNFRLSDYVEARLPLRHARCRQIDGGAVVDFAAGTGGETLLRMTVVLLSAQRIDLQFAALDADLNRFWLRLPAMVGERLWGGGEQMSYFNLRGRHFPLWTSEPGVGRDKSSPITFQADQKNGGGGDYYWTNYPQPTFISSRLYALHVETTAYAAFDFRHDLFHEIEVWEVPARIELSNAESFVDLVGTLSLRFGRQPPLPDWVLGGAIIGLKDGQTSFSRLEKIAAAGAAIAGLWCEDWVGLRITSFGKRLFWDWLWNSERYPDLPDRIDSLAADGIRFLGYVNPYLCTDGTLYPEAAERGLLALRQDRDEVYLVDFGEFLCGIVDFTNQAAADWFAERVLGTNMLDFGLSGWMADFGEYLPTDVRLHSGLDGMKAHNAWPTLWAKVNADAIASRGRTGDALFFMRAGYSGVQGFCPLLWAGDQSVDFSRHDGLQTVICAALSSGMLGNAYHHSDIGGYTSLFGNVRSAELLQRWAEMAAFTAVMRSHEGNRPGENLQIDQEPAVLAHFARMTRIYRTLAPYIRHLSAQAVATGLPLQRPLFLHFEQDARAYDSQTSYLFGAELLVAPVIDPGVTRWRAYLPEGVDWVHLWSGEPYAGGQEVEVAAPLGWIPVFYRRDAAHAALFASLRDIE